MKTLHTSINKLKQILANQNITVYRGMLVDANKINDWLSRKGQSYPIHSNWGKQINVSMKKELAKEYALSYAQDQFKTDPDGMTESLGFNLKQGQPILLTLQTPLTNIMIDGELLLIGNDHPLPTQNDILNLTSWFQQNSERYELLIRDASNTIIKNIELLN